MNKEEKKQIENEKETKQFFFTPAEITQDEDDIKDRRIDDVLVNLYTYIYFLEVLIENNQRSDESKVMHMNLIVDKMHEEINKLAKYYDFIEMFNEANIPKWKRTDLTKNEKS